MSGGEPLAVGDGIVIPAADLSWTSARASGPGGQNVNKVESKVDLRFDLAGTRALPEEVKARLRARCARRLDAEGRIAVTSQRTRDRAKNLADAREKLRRLIAAALRPPRRRRPTKPSRAAVARRLDGKRRQGVKKAGRRDAGGE